MCLIRLKTKTVGSYSLYMIVSGHFGTSPEYKAIYKLFKYTLCTKVNKFIKRNKQTLNFNSLFFEQCKIESQY